MLYGLIFANGDFNEGPAVSAALQYIGQPLSETTANDSSRFIVAADGGLRHVLALGLHPDLVVGDMDSVDPDALRAAEAHGAEIHRSPAAKDETDLELALIASAKRGCNPLRIVGGIGGRLDQTISNIYLLALPALRNRDVRLVDGRQTAWLAYPGLNEVTGKPGDTVSLIPLAGDAMGIVTEGLQYPLRHEALLFGPARGVSNVMSGTHATFSLESGILLAIHTVGRA